MQSKLATTPRNLGSLRLPGYCPKCLKYLLCMKHQPPFNHFGAAIFGDAQKSQEAIIGYYLDNNGCLPKEFAPFCDCVARTEFPRHWSKFSYLHKSGVTLYGAPDEIFERKDGTLCVVDHKTAHFKGDKDPFHAQYECQVVGYANIAEGLNLGKVTLGGLLYWEAQVEEVQYDPIAHYKSGKLSLPLKPKTLEIEIDYDILDPALEEFKSVASSSSLPEGRDGCMDCKKLDLMFALEEEFLNKDQQLFRYIKSEREFRNTMLTRDYHRRARRRIALLEFSQLGEEMFASDGLVANWQFDPFQEETSYAD
jgi:PD-(D/E)XK nuclease superfamily